MFIFSDANEDLPPKIRPLKFLQRLLGTKEQKMEARTAEKERGLLADLGLTKDEVLDIAEKMIERNKDKTEQKLEDERKIINPFRPQPSTGFPRRPSETLLPPAVVVEKPERKTPLQQAMELFGTLADQAISVQETKQKEQDPAKALLNKAQKALKKYVEFQLVNDSDTKETGIRGAQGLWENLVSEISHRETILSQPVKLPETNRSKINHILDIVEKSLNLVEGTIDQVSHTLLQNRGTDADSSDEVPDKLPIWRRPLNGSDGTLKFKSVLTYFVKSYLLYREFKNKLHKL